MKTITKPEAKNKTPVLGRPKKISSITQRINTTMTASIMWMPTFAFKKTKKIHPMEFFDIQ